jgi:uncharacterized protein YeaC (DUF1315 family)
MNDGVYEITESRLKALSPAAQRLASAAIEIGKWKIVPEDTGEGRSKC